MTDAKAVLAYFKGFREWAEAKDRHHYDALERLLAEPRLPTELSDEMVAAICQAAAQSAGKSRRLWAEEIVVAIRDFRPKPRTKMVWRVRRGTDFRCDFEEIADAVTFLAADPKGASMYQYEVPADD